MLLQYAAAGDAGLFAGSRTGPHLPHVDPHVCFYGLHCLPHHPHHTHNRSETEVCVCVCVWVGLR